MQINLILPDNFAEPMEAARVKHGLRSRQAFIRAAIENFMGAAVPEAKPAPDVTLAYPLRERRHVCPYCLAGNHCGAEVVEMVDRFAKMRDRWICECPECNRVKPVGIRVVPASR